MKTWFCGLFLGFSFSSFAQNCGDVQQLSAQQTTDLGPYVQLLDTALVHEDFQAVDSLNARILQIFGAEAGIPDAVESYYTLTANSTWLTIPESIQLSRALIDTDTTFYSELWKLAKGILPPNDDPHAIFLRTAAETAAGLLKIADRETDVFRQNRYRYWATRALDSLSTMQLPNGAFPFPDLRDYNDPVFTSIIQNFMFACGDDSVNVLQNGWIIDDKGTGEFKFDAGVIAEAYYDAYLYTADINYFNTVISIADYVLPLHLNRNYNYNTFVAMALTRAAILSANNTYLQRATENLRYGLLPGQAENGRWVDGHNANSRYHNLIIANCSPYFSQLPIANPDWSLLETMYNKAVENLTNYSYSCESATGFRWLTEAYLVPVIPTSVKDSMRTLIGRHIQQAAINGKYLNVAVLGDYIELLDIMAMLPEKETSELTIWPNPANQAVTIQLPKDVEEELITCRLFAPDGTEIPVANPIEGEHALSLDVSSLPVGVYFLKIVDSTHSFISEIQIIR